jgi:hypothetical protein
VARTEGWHKFGIRLQSNATAVFFIDGQQVGSLTGQFATAAEVSLDGYDTGTPSTSTTYYVDDARVRKYASPEPSVTAGGNTVPPQWRNQSQSSATPPRGSAVLLSAQGFDDNALRTATLETNETGTWAPKTAYGSPMSLGDAANAWVTSTFNWSSAAVPVGTIVSWRIRYADASGNTTSTDEMSFTIQTPPPDTEPPQFSSPSVSTTTAGLPAEFRLKWTDNVGLDAYVFSIDNGTGTFVDDAPVTFSAPTDAWASATKTLNTTPGQTIRWKFTATDISGSGNARTSDTYSFVTERDTSPTVYVVIAIDTENGNIDWYPGQPRDHDPNPLFDTHFYKRAGVYTSEIFSDAFRASHVDSFGGTFKMSWFAEMDKQFDAATYLDEGPDHPELTGQHVGYTGIMDALLRYWSPEITRFGDGIYWHHHVQAWTGTLWAANESVISSYTHHYDALNHMLIDRSYFPSVYRAGWLWEDSNMNTFLNAWEPFDYSASSGAWVPYHPNTSDPWSAAAPNLVRWMTRTDNGANQGSANAAFAYALSNGAALYSIYFHDRDDMPGYINGLQSVLTTAAANYPTVKFKYVAALEGIQSVLGLTDRTPPSLIFSKVGASTYQITSSESVWQGSPYVAAKYSGVSGELYQQIAATSSGINAWTSTIPAQTDIASPPVKFTPSGVTASSERTVSDGEPGPATKAIDGNEGTYWESAHRKPDGNWGGQVPQWISVDLGVIQTVNSLYIHFYDGRTYTYYVEASSDGTSWTQIVPSNGVNGRVTHNFSPANNLRYARITVTGNTANNWAHIYEIALNGPSAPSQTFDLVKVMAAASDVSGNTAITPLCAPEVCDNLDNDCDGVIDNGNPGGGGACSTGQSGVCAAGTQQCTAGVLTCVRNVGPTAESCNGLDDDCNGTVDDGDPGGGAVCATGLPGVCTPGTMHCVSAAVSCQPNTPSSAEICDHLDNDCNGTVDDGITATMTIPSNLAQIPTQIIGVPMQLGDVTGKGVYAAEMHVTFDATVLSAGSVVLGGGLTGNCTLTDNLDTPGQVLIAIYCTAPLTGSPTLANVSFSVVTPTYGRTTALGFSAAKLNEGCPAVTTVPGSFTVRGPEICDGQDNDGIGGIDEICTVSGAVLYYRDSTPPGEPSLKPVPNVGIAVAGTVPSQTETDGTGAYVVGNLHGTVTVAPQNKLGDHNGAVSSTDAAAVAMAAVGNGSPLSVNQVFAGDVTGNHTISALDASYIARFSAALVTEFPVAATAGSDWKFLKCVPDYAGTCGDPVSYTIDPITGPQTAKDFYAILYGDVTGNWTAPGSGFAASRAAIPSEENNALIRDLEIADRFRREGAPPVIERRPGTAAAELSLVGWKPLRAGERRQLTVELRNADGILGLDLVLRYDPSRLAIVGVQGTGIGSALSVARADQHGMQRIAAYGYAALSGSGSILTITVEGLNDKGRQLPPTIGGVANEGGIPLRVRERGQTPPMRR